MQNTTLKTQPINTNRKTTSNRYLTHRNNSLYSQQDAPNKKDKCAKIE